jgi:thiamine biosynthesis lipoprotein
MFLWWSTEMAERLARPLTRRRVLRVLAAAAAVSLSGRAHAQARAERWVWKGTALGADAVLIFYHPDRRLVNETVAACLAEVERLEREFSLYRPDSALSRLNRDGMLEAPSLDLLAVLEQSTAVAVATGGAFDVSVQPLWALYAGHFARHPLDPAGPSATAIREACQRVDYRRIAVTAERIRLVPGMALTLNGIAQGYITDRVADLLRHRGWTNVMINLGEIRTLGGRADGTGWTLARNHPVAGEGDLPRLEVRDIAVATSSAAGTVFDALGHHHHLFDPRTGRSAALCRQVTVLAASAMTADALSTALCITPSAARQSVLHQFPATACEILETDGRVSAVTA